MRETLSPRLSALLERGLDGEDFWDMCCDHGYLGRDALRSDRFSKVHFVDRVPHIIAKVQERFGDAEGATIRLSCAGDVTEEIRGTVAMAGVGGFNLIDVLTRLDQRGNLRAGRLLLNPMTHIKELRAFLAVWPRYVEVETVVINERGKLREILVLDRRT